MYMKENDLCLEEYLQGIEDGTIQVPPRTETEDVTLEDEPGGEDTEEDIPAEEEPGEEEPVDEDGSEEDEDAA